MNEDISEDLGEGFPPPAEIYETGAPAPATGELMVSSFGGVITAQRVAVPRNEVAIRRKLAALCAAAGERYIYSWPVRDRANRRTTTVQGPTIKLANDLARTYGNCVIDVRALDHPTFTMFYARFTDLESGYALVRAFRQRKDQDTGMRDIGRAEDIVFQIGQSKAIRNVVVNALASHVDFMVEEAEKNLLAMIENNREKAEDFIDRAAERYNIDMARIEAVVGRAKKKWTLRDVARVFSELRGISEGLTAADDIYPSEEDAAAVTDAKSKLDDFAGVGAEGPAKPAKRKRRTKAEMAAVRAAEEAAAKEETEGTATTPTDDEVAAQADAKLGEQEAAAEQPPPEQQAEGDDGDDLFGED